MPAVPAAVVLKQPEFSLSVVSDRMLSLCYDTEKDGIF